MYRFLILLIMSAPAMAQDEIFESLPDGGLSFSFGLSEHYPSFEDLRSLWMSEAAKKCGPSGFIVSYYREVKEHKGDALLRDPNTGKLVAETIPAGVSGFIRCQ